MKSKQWMPHEADEQAALIEWAERMSGRYPELKLLVHIPNGGSRNVIEAAKLKKQGVKAGFPDLMLPTARGNYHGLFIEMKRLKGGRIPAEQREWHEKLHAQGYRVRVCCGWETAKLEIEDYLEL